FCSRVAAQPPQSLARSLARTSYNCLSSESARAPDRAPGGVREEIRILQVGLSKTHSSDHAAPKNIEPLSIGDEQEKPVKSQSPIDELSPRLKNWLKQNDLEGDEKELLNENFDYASLFIITPDDLRECGISEERVEKYKNPLKRLRNINAPARELSPRLKNWLKQNNLEGDEEQLLDEKLDYATLFSITSDDLMKDCGISAERAKKYEEPLKRLRNTNAPARELSPRLKNWLKQNNLEGDEERLLDKNLDYATLFSITSDDLMKNCGISVERAERYAQPLKVLRGANTSSRFTDLLVQCKAAGQAFTIGRKADFNMEDGRISRRHATVSFKDKEAYITDNSTFGTWLNGRKLETGRPTPFTFGDTLRLGDENIKHGDDGFLFIAIGQGAEASQPGMPDTSYIEITPGTEEHREIKIMGGGPIGIFVRGSDGKIRRFPVATQGKTSWMGWSEIGGERISTSLANQFNWIYDAPRTDVIEMLGEYVLSAANDSVSYQYKGQACERVKGGSERMAAYELSPGKWMIPQAVFRGCTAACVDMLVAEGASRDQVKRPVQKEPRRAVYFPSKRLTLDA
ncbi:MULTISPECIES: FHA domain-containing protein, partial [unclassified Caballeronia]|uniref:FHA domain-containing protein n=1 Tax=unclassified Caballeronia TaxID=2646786 RepID=UPI0020290A16